MTVLEVLAWYAGGSLGMFGIITGMVLWSDNRKERRRNGNR